LVKILSDTNRVKIIALLYKGKKLCIGEICDTLQLSQPLVSRHLKQMREAALVETKQRGKWVIYSLHVNKTLSCLLDILQEDIATLPKITACAREWE